MIETLNLKCWHELESEQTQNAINLLEQGSVLFLPNLAFTLSEPESALLRPDLVNTKTKNISFDQSKATINGAICSDAEQVQIKAMMQRYAQQTKSFISKLFNPYSDKLQPGRTSFRPVQIHGRTSSYKKDDTRLHVDAFPSSPIQGKRILRIFSNINPHGLSRHWRLGTTFEKVVQHFLPRLKNPLWGTHTLLHKFKITKTKRSLYDHYMLQLHDNMKYDLNYQAEVPQSEFHFPPNSTWIVFTDQVSHAAMSGQHVLEQTFYLPFTAMVDENRAPIRILERYLGKKLLENSV